MQHQCRRRGRGFRYTNTPETDNWRDLNGGLRYKCSMVQQWLGSECLCFPLATIVPSISAFAAPREASSFGTTGEDQQLTCSFALMPLQKW